jgi:hypothetical protein
MAGEFFSTSACVDVVAPNIFWRTVTDLSFVPFLCLGCGLRRQTPLFFLALLSVDGEEVWVEERGGKEEEDASRPGTECQ